MINKCIRKQTSLVACMPFKIVLILHIKSSQKKDTSIRFAILFKKNMRQY